MKTVSLAVLVALAIALVSPALAAPRTTPTTIVNVPTVRFDPEGNTVKIDPAANTVKIDATTNTVKASQSGGWNVGVSGAVSISGTPSVAQSGTWNVGILSTANSVKVPVQSQMVRLFTSNQTVPAQSARAAYLDTAGYRTMYVVLIANFIDNRDVTASLGMLGPDNSYRQLGVARFNTAPPPFFQGGDFELSSGYCVFSAPVMFGSIYVQVTNNTANAITVYSSSYVYLTD